MCEQCNANPVSFGEVLPGWVLMRARRDGQEWLKGEWGLVSSNDPTFTWTSTPTPSALFGIEDEDEQQAWFDACDKDDPMRERVMEPPPEDFDRAFQCDPALGYDLVRAGMTKGFDPVEGGLFTHWLFDLFGEHLKTAEMTEVNHDAFPEREANHPSDLTIGRD